MPDFANLEAFLIYHGMVLVEGDDVGLTLKKGDRLKPRTCLKQDESEIRADLVRQRATELLGNRSLADGFYMLANQDDILGEFADSVSYIILPGTLLCGRDGEKGMACLYVDGDRWNIMLLTFERGYMEDDFIACNDE